MRYVIHCFFLGLYASLESARVSEQGYASEHGAMVLRDDLVYDLTESLIRVGIRPGMKRETAGRLAPAAVSVKYDAARMKECLRPLWQSICDITPWIETAERELFFALSGRDPREELRTMLKTWNRLFSHSGWRMAGGVGVNKLIARMASRAAYAGKSHGMPVLRIGDQTIVFVEDEKSWMEAASIRDIWQLPVTIQMRLRELGVHTASDLLVVSERDLRMHFGKEAIQWYSLARGEDRSALRINFPPLVREVSWRSREQATPVERMSFVVQRMVKELAFHLESETAAAERLFLQVEGSDASGAEVWEERDVRLAKPVSSTGEILRQVEKVLSLIALQSVSALLIALGELRPRAARQLEWGIAENVLCEPLWPKQAGVDQVCAELQQRFSVQTIRRGCVRSVRERRLALIDPVRGGVLA